jgi:hypothetical protein
MRDIFFDSESNDLNPDHRTIRKLDWNKLAV